MIMFIYTLLLLPLIFSSGEDLKPDPTGDVSDNLKKDKPTEELSEKKEIKMAVLIMTVMMRMKTKTIQAL